MRQLKGILWLVLAALSVVPAAAQVFPSPYFCQAAVSVPPLMRAEGLTEQIGDIVLTCTGGSAQEYAIGQPLPTANITVSLGTNITSRLLDTTTSPNITEALLLIDEPGSSLPSPVPGWGPQAPQKVCSSALLGAGPGGCVQYAQTVPFGGVTYTVESSSATSATPPANIFQGTWSPTAPNQITFLNVPILPPVVSGQSRIYRITNLRADVASLPGAGLTINSLLSASLSISSSTSITLDNPIETVGFIESSLGVTLADLNGKPILTSPALSECSSWSVLTPTDILQFSETFANDWKTRDNAGAAANYTQNIPGTIYNTESGFTIATPSGAAGLADYGTRLKATFHSVPSGVRLFVSVANVANLSTPAPVGGTAAALVASETASDGATAANFPAVAATTTINGVPAAELTVDSTGTAEAVWEITADNPAALEMANFVVYQLASSPPAIPAGLAAAAVTVNMTYAPSLPPGISEATSPWENASSTLTEPRFIDLSVPLTAFGYIACNVPSLSLMVSHTGNFQQGATALYTIAVSDAGTSTSGAIVVTELPSTALSIVNMSGTGWACGPTTCTRGDSLASGASYPPITVTASVSANAGTQVSNSVTVTGGGSGSASATDVAWVAALGILSSCTSLQFTANGSQNCVLTSNGDTEAIAGAYTVSGGNWLFVSPGFGEALPFTLAVTVSASGLAPGVYTGNVVVYGYGNSSDQFNIPVTLTVSSCTATVSPTSISAAALGATGSISVTILATCGAWEASSLADWIDVSVTIATGSASVAYSIDPNFGAARASQILLAGESIAVTQSGLTGLSFYPVTPCRIADTRSGSGAFGAPSLAANSTRSFPIATSACGIPATAVAYSLNATVVPAAALAYLTLWPTGQPQPYVSTLNSANGAVVANAAIVPAGSPNGAVSAYASDQTDLILDIDGYFAPPGTSGLAFYPLEPCRVADTRTAAGSLGGPALAANSTRSFPLSIGSCGLPSSGAAGAYSLNLTVVPPGPLDYLSAWATGAAQPVVSTLNALDGRIAANAAIVPAGGPGSISVYASDPTNLIVDTNGYFGTPVGQTPLYFYPLTPCRAVDTRTAAGPLGGPTLAANTTRSFMLPSSSCGIPANALAYSLNITAVPQGPLLYLTAWPAGQNQPVVSTLNAQQGLPVANAAIVPAGANGAVNIFVPSLSDVIIDINGYFAYLQ